MIAEAVCCGNPAASRFPDQDRYFAIVGVRPFLANVRCLIAHHNEQSALHRTAGFPILHD
jgi:hypothetical protein